MLKMGEILGSKGFNLSKNTWVLKRYKSTKPKQKKWEGLKI